MSDSVQEASTLSLDGQRLMRDIEALFRRHVVFVHDDHPTIVALWCMFAHAHDAFQFSPFLALTSPGPASGKSTVLDILHRLTPRAYIVTDLTPSVLYRITENHNPTLLLDEFDELFQNHPQIIGILNGSYSRKATVFRSESSENGSYSPEPYSAWYPKALAGIGAIPRALESRTITILMLPKAPNEKALPLSIELDVEQMILHKELEQWALTNESALAAALPELPPGLHNRQRDTWKPLLAIADCVGGVYPALAREIALRYVSGASQGDDAQLFLADCRVAFREKSVEGRISSQVLCEFLNGLDDRPWGELNGESGLTMNDVAARLKMFGIKPDRRRVKSDKESKSPGKSLRGYHVDDFREVFRRYFPPLVGGMERPEQTEQVLPDVPSVPCVPDVPKGTHTDVQLIDHSTNAERGSNAN